MKKKSVIMVFAVTVLVSSLILGQTETICSIYVIKNATIVTVTKGIIEAGTLVIENDKIVAVGKDITVPADAVVIDGTGLFIYPGLIDASTTLGLSEVGSVPATQDGFEIGTYNPHIKAIVAINPHSVHIPISRVNGITSVLVVPSGGAISGQCALINLNGWTSEEMVLKTPAAIGISFPHVPTDEEIKRRSARSSQQTGSGSAKERAEKQIKDLKEVFLKAKRYAARWEHFKKSQQLQTPEKNLMLEALIPVIQKELPVVISVDSEGDIKNAIKFVNELDIKAIFRGVSDGWKVAPILKKNNIAVLVGPVLRSPGSKDPYDARYANAAVLHKAGVKIAFITGSSSDVRSLPYHAGTAAAYGLSREEALKAVTINPAEIFGVADKIGSIEVGKMANVIVSDGDPLEMRTQIKHLFIGGEKIDLKSKHTELYQKFRKRPKR